MKHTVQVNIELVTEYDDTYPEALTLEMLLSKMSNIYSFDYKEYIAWHGFGAINNIALKHKVTIDGLLIKDINKLKAKQDV